MCRGRPGLTRCGARSARSRCGAATGLVDPTVEVRPDLGPDHDLLARVKKRTELGQRSLVTTLTKRFAEDLPTPARIRGQGRYLHSELDAMERISVLTGPSNRRLDVVVGINLLRRGTRPARGGVHPASWTPTKRAYLRAFRSFNPDHRPRGAQCRRACRDVRGQDHRLDAPGSG